MREENGTDLRRMFVQYTFHHHRTSWSWLLPAKKLDIVENKCAISCSYEMLHLSKPTEMMFWSWSSIVRRDSFRLFAYDLHGQNMLSTASLVDIPFYFVGRRVFTEWLMLRHRKRREVLIRAKEKRLFQTEEWAQDEKECRLRRLEKHFQRSPSPTCKFKRLGPKPQRPPQYRGETY